MTEIRGHHANSGGRGREEAGHDRRFNALSRASQAHSSVNSRDTIPHPVKGQTCYESGVTSPEYLIGCHINSV